MHQFNYEGEMYVGSTRKLISSKKPSLLYQRAVVNSFLTYREYYCYPQLKTSCKLSII